VLVKDIFLVNGTFTIWKTVMVCLFNRKKMEFGFD